MKPQSKQLEVTVTGSLYTYQCDGSIEPYICISPAILSVDNKLIHRIPVAYLDKDSDFCLAKGDRIALTISKKLKLLLKVVSSTASNEEKVDLLSDRCPICHEILHAPIAPNSIGCCVNRSCGAQVLNATLLFLSSLQLAMTGNNLKILNLLYAEGKLSEISDVFRANLSDLYFDDITEIDARTFIQYIHSVRGNVNVSQVLRGLNIPNLSSETIEQVACIFTENQYVLPQLPNFFEEEYLSKYPNIDWTAWKDFIKVYKNQELIKKLCTILYI